MTPVADQLPPGGRVLVIRLRSLGDCVLTTPAIAMLHRYRPDLEIAVMADDAFRPVFAHNPAVRALPRPELGEALAFRPHLALNLHGGTRSMQLTAASLARWRAGFEHHSGAGLLYNVPIPRAQQILGEERTVHTAEHLASAMFYLGVPRAEAPRASLYTEREAPRPEAPYAIFHPFAATPEKTWPAERFARLADQVKRGWGLDPVIIGSAGDGFTPFRQFPCLRGAPLEEIKQRMSRASLFVGNDSGPAHIAAAYAVPVLVLFGPSDEVVWRPWRTRHELLKNAAGCDGIPYEDAVAALGRLGVTA
ncbi:MAG: glycosyltransferase family 9 protein [Bryobacterales bacterium]|nr:glycosyltransferase family 9 protein [Bryobacterales bacterium]